MPSCALRYCKSRGKGNGHVESLFSFPPLSSELREKWIRFVQMDRREEYWLPSASSKICSKHFRKGDIYFGKTGRTVLKKDSVPYLPTSEFQDKKYTEATTPVTPISFKITYPEPIITAKEIELRAQLHRLQKIKLFHAEKIKKIAQHNKNLERKILNLKCFINEFKRQFDSKIEKDNTINATAEVQALYDRHKKRFNMKKFSPSIRNFAINLHKYSPTAYEYVRKSFSNVFPNVKTLCRWRKCDKLNQKL